MKRGKAVTPDPLDAMRLPVMPVEPRPEFAASLLRRLRGEPPLVSGRGATVRYFVADLDAAVAFYCDLLGFDEELRPAPSFAMLYHGDLRLLLSVPGAAHAMPDGTLPDPGGWNRIVIQVPDIAVAVDGLRARGVRFRREIVMSAGVRQALLEDPSGNLVELFEPGAGYHERSSRSRQ
jgi:catechol 2,3-dioxygenase-like lactoylglutathione lyase family enzyme